MAKQYSSAPDLDIDLSATHSAVIHTSAGDIHVDLYLSLIHISEPTRR